MNEPEAKQIPAAADVAQVARAIRFALVVIVLPVSCLSFQTSLRIERFRVLFMDMLGGAPLPPLTAFIIYARYLFVTVGFLVLLAVLGTLFLRNLARSFYFLGILTLVTLIEFILLCYGLAAPLMSITNAMSGQ